MKESPPIIIFLVFLLGIVSVFAFQNMNASISIDPTSALVQDILSPLPTILDKLTEKDDELARVPISIGTKEITYYENRYTILPNVALADCEKKKNLWDEENSVCKVVSRKRSTDKERTIGLKLLNTETREVTVIAVKTKITINGVSIVAPNGYQIEIVERPNGIRWNWWNTLYRVVSPENSVVIENLWPREEMVPVTRVVNGKLKKETKKIVTGFPYVPHSEFFEREENKSVLVKAGTDYDKNIVFQSFEKLRKYGVISRAFPDKLVADVDALSPRFFERLVLLEQGDLTEFQLDSKKTVERVLIILGANGENAWIYTCNRSDACGWIQFTPRTYRSIRTMFPTAKLMPDFRTGAGDHLNSMMAAILLIDYNLADLLKRYGPKILEDPDILQRAYAGTYNGNPRHVWAALDADFGKVVISWTKYLKKETHGFLFKYDYLIENNLP
ncbi:MAG: hypothetical protein HY505_00685 [Candidatus Yanofskybacteria bacterium]|nr:hypothetical protein [Candidatus Yanofskybacteria bacterium]